MTSDDIVARLDLRPATVNTAAPTKVRPEMPLADPVALRVDLAATFVFGLEGASSAANAKLRLGRASCVQSAHYG